MLLILQLTVSHGSQYFRKAWKSLSPSNSTFTPFKLYSTLLVSLLTLFILYGSSVLKILAITLVFYFISKKFGSKSFAPILFWTFCIGILFLNNMYDGYRFSHIYILCMASKNDFVESIE